MNSNRFAYATGSYDGHGFPLVNKLTGVHVDIKVFDWKEMKQLAEVSLYKDVGSASPGYRQLAIALSPDGNLLAILDDANLSCYRLQ